MSSSSELQRIHYELDASDHSLVLKTGNGHLISIGHERAIQSEVWRVLLETEENSTKKRKVKASVEIKKETADKVIDLGEPTLTCCIFLRSFFQRDWEKKELHPDTVEGLLRLADTFKVNNAALYVPCMVEFRPIEWNLKQCLLIYHYCTSLNLQTLRNQAVRNFIRLGDVSVLGIDEEELNVATHHLVPLFTHKKKWLAQDIFAYKEVAGCRASNKCPKAWNNVKEQLVTGKIVFHDLCPAHIESLMKIHSSHSDMLNRLSL